MKANATDTATRPESAAPLALPNDANGNAALVDLELLLAVALLAVSWMSVAAAPSNKYVISSLPRRQRQRSDTH